MKTVGERVFDTRAIAVQIGGESEDDLFSVLGHEIGFQLFNAEELEIGLGLFECARIGRLERRSR